MLLDSSDLVNKVRDSGTSTYLYEFKFGVRPGVAGPGGSSESDYHSQADLEQSMIRVRDGVRRRHPPAAARRKPEPPSRPGSWYRQARPGPAARPLRVVSGQPEIWRDPATTLKEHGARLQPSLAPSTVTGTAGLVMRPGTARAESGPGLAGGPRRLQAQSIHRVAGNFTDRRCQKNP